MQLLDACHELVVALLTLRSADNLTDIREKHVHCTHGLAVVVELHVEGLDLLWIICKDYRALEVLLHEIALVLALQVDTPLYRELKFLARLLENLDTLSVGKAHKVVVEHEVESLDKLLVVHLLKEFNIVAAVLKSIADAIFHKVLSKVHVVGNVVEGNLRLNHPELCQVARSVGVFGTECRSESINCAKCGCSKLTLKLS